jgi:SNF2 family DNA or RNA helicase
VNPKLFKYITKFRNDYCITKPQYVRGGRQIQIVVGYKNLNDFISKIEPYYLSRRKYEVAKELPSLITKEVICYMTSDQQSVYESIEEEMNEIKIDDESSSLSLLVKLQQSADHPDLIEELSGYKSSKLETLLDMLDNELSERKTIVFSRFKSMINMIGDKLNDIGIKYSRVTGDENDPKIRQQAKLKFQDINSGVNVILITSAGAESINLQSADNFIFYDSPWSWGMYVQLIGRMIRIGSSHKTVIAHHLMSVKSNGKKTIDSYVIKKLKEKKKLADIVAGEGIKNGLEFSESNDRRQIIESIINDQ